MVSLRKLEELSATLPIPASSKPQYNGCLTTEQRQIMADIYKGAKLSPVKVTKRSFAKYRKEWE